VDPSDPSQTESSRQGPLTCQDASYIAGEALALFKRLGGAQVGSVWAAVQWPPAPQLPEMHVAGLLQPSLCIMVVRSSPILGGSTKHNKVAGESLCNLQHI
jgi:hypothetical protein